MAGILTILHAVVCVLMITIILLQTGKGASMGAAFGGGYSQTIFGSAGPVGFLNKLTTMVAVFFMLTSLVLAFMASQSPTKTVVDEVPQQEAPAAPGPGGEGD
ncbi:MAG: preprotein translocase subunit SecG [Deltaproteobacteria bacterium]|nr:MAG: preprotein translocase subunit SecG [Deltaproteobacteria bacterium]